jgi:hypothetical protein
MPNWLICASLNGHSQQKSAKNNRQAWDCPENGVSSPITLSAKLLLDRTKIGAFPGLIRAGSRVVYLGHGRRARRTIKAVLVPAWIGFAGAAQVAQVRRTVTRKGKKTVVVVYLITSDRDADPATLAAWVRGHQEIENRLHQASKTLRRSMTLPPRCGSGPGACWAWRQQLGC